MFGLTVFGLFPKEIIQGLTTGIIMVILFHRYRINYLPVTQKQVILY